MISVFVVIGVFVVFIVFKREVFLFFCFVISISFYIGGWKGVEKGFFILRICFFI